MSGDGTAKESQYSEKPERVWTPEEQAVFDALEAGETMHSACRLLGLSYDGLYYRRQHDKALNVAIEAANHRGRLNQASKIAKSLYAGAEKCADDPRFTTAAIFALKNLDPANWRDSHEISGPGGGAIPLQVVMFGQPEQAEAQAQADTDETDHGGGVPADETQSS